MMCEEYPDPEPYEPSEVTFGSDSSWLASHDPTKELKITLYQGDLEWFKELIQRGSNLWPDAPPAAKVFADLITTGSVQQDYSTQAR